MGAVERAMPGAELQCPGRGMIAVARCIADRAAGRKACEDCPVHVVCPECGHRLSVVSDEGTWSNLRCWHDMGSGNDRKPGCGWEGDRMEWAQGAALAQHLGLEHRRITESGGQMRMRSIEDTKGRQSSSKSTDREAEVKGIEQKATARKREQTGAKPHKGEVNPRSHDCAGGCGALVVNEGALCRSCAQLMRPVLQDVTAELEHRGWRIKVSGPAQGVAEVARRVMVGGGGDE